MTTATTATTASAGSSSVSNIWWLFLLQGISAIILGGMLLTAPVKTVILLITFLGFYWLISGVLSLVQVFVDRSSPRKWSLLNGVLGFAAGLLVLRDPLVAALTVPTIIVIILGIEALIMGVASVIAGFQGGGGGSFLLGAFNILIGVLLLSSPVAAAFAVPFVFGVILLVQGVSLIIWAFRIRA